ncbi:hypothetical protein GBAR_LOCUS14511, partial [Geodia barretti]
LVCVLDKTLSGLVPLFVTRSTVLIPSAGSPSLTSPLRSSKIELLEQQSQQHYYIV